MWSGSIKIGFLKNMHLNLGLSIGVVLSFALVESFGLAGTRCNYAVQSDALRVQNIQNAKE